MPGAYVHRAAQRASQGWHGGPETLSVTDLVEKLASSQLARVEKARLSNTVDRRK